MTYTKTNETRDGGSMSQIDKTWHSLRHVGLHLLIVNAFSNNAVLPCVGLMPRPSAARAFGRECIGSEVQMSIQEERMSEESCLAQTCGAAAARSSGFKLPRSSKSVLRFAECVKTRKQHMYLAKIRARWPVCDHHVTGDEAVV